MNLPWLQVERTALDSADELAARLGVSQNEALGAIVRLWFKAQALADARDDEPGFMKTNEPEELLMRLCGISSTKNDMHVDMVATKNDIKPTILRHAEAVGLVEIRPLGVRIKGLTRYVEAEQKRSAKNELNAQRCRIYREEQKKRHAVDMQSRHAVDMQSRPLATSPREHNTTQHNKKPTVVSKKASKRTERVSIENWQGFVDWLDQIYFEATDRHFDWAGSELRALKELIKHHELKNEGRRELIGELWAVALSRPSKFIPIAENISQLRHKFEQIRCSADINDHISAWKAQTAFPAPAYLTNTENAPEGQPGALNDIPEGIQ